MFEFDWLQTNPNTPTLYTALITLLISFVLSTLIAITYERTTKNVPKNGHFLQALSLISTIAAMIMLAVGDSLAVGLGMLGALSIIRFRTSLNDPRNMTFMFASLAVGISCGVLGYSIAITGTLLFCTMVFILQFSSWGHTTPLLGVLRMVLDNKNIQIDEAEILIQPFCKFKELIAVRQPNSAAGKKMKRSRYEEVLFHIQLNDTVSKKDLLDEIEKKYSYSESTLFN